MHARTHTHTHIHTLVFLTGYTLIVCVVAVQNMDFYIPIVVLFCCVGGVVIRLDPGE